MTAAAAQLTRVLWDIEIRAPLDDLLLGIGVHEEELLVAYVTRDRDTGEKMPARWSGSPPAGVDDGEMVAWVLDCLEELAVHEVREAFHYCGVRVADPHREEHHEEGPDPRAAG